MLRRIFSPNNPGIRITILLWTILLIINLVAVWEIVSWRRTADALAQKDLELRAHAYGKALESALASRRGDFIFLSQASPLALAPAVVSQPDPLRRRWGRLEVEGALLLFLDSHPEVDKIVVRDSLARPLVVGGRREGAPVLLQASDHGGFPSSERGKLIGSWPLRQQGGAGGTLECVLDIATLLSLAVPTPGSVLEIVSEERKEEEVVGSGSGDDLVARSPVRDDGWPGPVSWTLLCREEPRRRIDSIALLASRYRGTVILNLVVMSLALVLGVVAVRQVRCTIALEAENRQQARVRELERQVIHSERLASVGRLAAGMAHEINNPLEGMSNYLTLLEDDLRSGRTGESIEVVGRVRQGLDRVAGVIRQVLTFSDRGTAPHESIDLTSVIEESLQFLKSNPKYQRIHFAVCHERNNLSVIGNRVTLGQLFLNLFLNACELQQDRGEVEIDSSGVGDFARIRVCDRGPGFSPELEARLFEPFFSTRGSTGLGLSVCHGIVAEHGGSIRAENRNGGGACFIVEIPLERGAGRSPGGEASILRSGA